MVMHVHELGRRLSGPGAPATPAEAARCKQLSLPPSPCPCSFQPAQYAMLAHFAEVVVREVERMQVRLPCLHPSA